MDVTGKERRQIADSILAKYDEVAKSPQGKFRYPTGKAGLEGQGYDPKLVERLPAEVAEFFAGVGNPLSLGRPEPGWRVLDIGCGAGVDALLAALMVGPEGEAVGVEFSPAMTARAETNRRSSGVRNAAFVEGAAESLPFDDESFDVVISNGVFNLVVDKNKALAEAYRVLKRGGRLQVADQMLVGQPASDREAAVASWFT